MAKILIVDDDQDFVQSVRSILEATGYDISAAHSRVEGMEAVKTVQPDLILLDVMMDEPDDGFTMAQDLRRGGVKTPILMLTSVGKVSGMAFDKDAEMVPVDAYEEKPIKPDRLLKRIQELIKA